MVGRCDSPATTVKRCKLRFFPRRGRVCFLPPCPATAAEIIEWGGLSTLLLSSEADSLPLCSERPVALLSPAAAALRYSAGSAVTTRATTTSGTTKALLDSTSCTSRTISAFTGVGTPAPSPAATTAPLR